jgi:cell division septation protein DedD
MGWGKIKDAWPVWTLVIAGVVIIVLALSQNKPEKDAVTFQDIFPDDQTTKTASPVSSGPAVVADPVQSPAIVANADYSPQQLSYAVQLYSFKEQARADTMINTLKAEGIPAYAQISDLGTKGTWYRVRVGSYKTADEAKAMLSNLIKDHKDSIIVKDRK